MKGSKELLPACKARAVERGAQPSARLLDISHESGALNLVVLYDRDAYHDDGPGAAAPSGTFSALATSTQMRSGSGEAAM